MKYFSYDHLIIIPILTIIFIIIALACSWLVIENSKNIIPNGNEQITWGIIELGNGELIEGKVTSWKDYNESDMIQVTMDNITYLTHSSNVILCSEEP